MAAQTLSDVCQELRRIYGQRAPGYASIWRAASEGRIPATRKGRSWIVDSGDYERIRVAMDLPVRARAA